jgi:hypothetical protein
MSRLLAWVARTAGIGLASDIDLRSRRRSTPAIGVSFAPRIDLRCRGSAPAIRIGLTADIGMAPERAEPSPEGIEGDRRREQGCGQDGGGKSAAHGGISGAAPARASLARGAALAMVGARNGPSTKIPVFRQWGYR